MGVRLLAMMALKTKVNKMKTPAEEIIKESSERKEKAIPVEDNLTRKGMK